MSPRRTSREGKATSLLGGQLGKVGQRCPQLSLVVSIITELASLVIDIGLHVEVAMAAEVKKDRPRGAFGLAAHRLPYGTAHRGVGLARRQDSFDARKLNSSFKAARLRQGARFDQPEFLQKANQWGHAVISQPARMEAGRHEGRTQGVHLYERRQMPRIAEVVGISAARQARAGGGLTGDHARLWTAAQPSADEGEGDSREI